ncbi:hypothetical protein [Saccharomonospora saliphila]|uniref:hypothetical protein n=1 Tax=Saccharomonospora saliphila TaxID=369829 RepID=UPI001E5F5B17|nr:hypothetical protein [Saccharomonospora saliphila]
MTTMHPMARPATADSERVVAGLEEVGAWFGESLPMGTVVATHATGALGYRAGPSLVVVDVFGRTDEHIARDGEQRGFVGARFVARDYDYVLTTRVPSVAVEDATYTREQQCGINPAYAGLFEVASFRRTAGPYWVTVYVRSALSGHLIDRLDAHPDYEYVSCR